MVRPSWIAREAFIQKNTIKEYFCWSWQQVVSWEYIIHTTPEWFLIFLYPSVMFRGIKKKWMTCVQRIEWTKVISMNKPCSKSLSLCCCFFLRNRWSTWWRLTSESQTFDWEGNLPKSQTRKKTKQTARIWIIGTVPITILLPVWEISPRFFFFSFVNLGMYF